MVILKRKELWIWGGGIVLLYWFPLGNEGSLCLLHHLGFEHCPGCGLGKSVHYLLHGSFSRSWETHPMAGPVVAGIGYRIFSLTRTKRI